MQIKCKTVRVQSISIGISYADLSSRYSMHDGHIIVDGCDKCPCTVCVHCCRRGSSVIAVSSVVVEVTLLSSRYAVTCLFSGLSRVCCLGSVSGPSRVRPGSVSGLSRARPGSVPGLSRVRPGSVPGLSRACLGSVSGPSRVCLGFVSGLSRARPGSVPGLSRVRPAALVRGARGATGAR